MTIHHTGALDGANIQTVSVEKLKPYKRNARTHSQKQLTQIANSIKQFGFLNPVLVDKRNRIIAGHGRVEAAKKIGLKFVPMLRIEHLTRDQKRAYMLADNKIALNAGWDTEMLAIELQHLSVSIDFDIEVTGFEMAEIDLLIEGLEFDEDDEPEEMVIDSEGPAITKPGNIWHLGEHRLICADATKHSSYRKLMQKRKANMIFTDPPYNVPIEGHVCGLGSVKHREFAMATGEMDEQQFAHFLQQTCKQLVAFSRNGSIHFICMDWRHIYELLFGG